MRGRCNLKHTKFSSYIATETLIVITSEAVTAIKGTLNTILVDGIVLRDTTMWNTVKS
jgi:hypothetical protein